jgi:hypothetical protein
MVTVTESAAMAACGSVDRWLVELRSSNKKHIITYLSTIF